MSGVKANIFDHVLYEFEMYVYSYAMMMRIMERQEMDQNLYNMALESHSVHLRNLIEFFNGAPNCINTKSILSIPHDFSISGEPFDSLEVKQYVNKAVDHLTEERFEWDGDAKKNLTERQKKIPVTVFTLYMVTRIKAFLNLLLTGADVKIKYQNDCSDTTIHARINNLLNILCEVSDEVF